MCTGRERGRNEGVTPPEPDTPLSGDERRRLEQLERQLIGQFPDLHTTLRGNGNRAVARFEVAVVAVLAPVLLVLAVLAGGLGLAAALLLSMAATAGLRFGARAMARRSARTSRPPGVVG